MTYNTTVWWVFPWVHHCKDFYWLPINFVLYREVKRGENKRRQKESKWNNQKWYDAFRFQLINKHLLYMSYNNRKLMLWVFISMQWIVLCFIWVERTGFEQTLSVSFPTDTGLCTCSSRRITRQLTGFINKNLIIIMILCLHIYNCIFHGFHIFDIFRFFINVIDFDVSTYLNWV